MVAGFCMACPESPATAAEDLREIGPTFHFAPPRVFEALLTRVMIRMEDASALKRWLFRHFMGVARRWGEKIVNREPVPLARAAALCARRVPDLRAAEEHARLHAHSRRLYRRRGDRRGPVRLLPLARAQPEAALRPDRGLSLCDRAGRRRGALRHGRAARAACAIAHRRGRRGAVQIAGHVRRLLQRAGQDQRSADRGRLRQDRRRRLLRARRAAQDRRPRQGRRQARQRAAVRAQIYREQAQVLRRHPRGGRARRRARLRRGHAQHRARLGRQLGRAQRRLLRLLSGARRP